MDDNVENKLIVAGALGLDATAALFGVTIPVASLTVAGADVLGSGFAAIFNDKLEAFLKYAKDTSQEEQEKFLASFD